MSISTSVPRPQSKCAEDILNFIEICFYKCNNTSQSMVSLNNSEILFSPALLSHRPVMLLC